MRLNSLNRDMFKPFRSHNGLLGWVLFAVCLRICTGFKGVSFRETYLWEHFGRTDQIALIACLKKLNVSAASLYKTRERRVRARYDAELPPIIYIVRCPGRPVILGMEKCQGRKKPWQPQTWQDLTRSSPLDFSLLSPDFRELVLPNCT